MGQPVHRFLEEFATEDALIAPSTVYPFRPRLAAPPPEPPLAVARMAEAYAKGYEEGRSEARAQAEAEVAALRADFGVQLEQTMSKFSDRLGDNLAAQLASQIERLFAAMADQVALALHPIMRHVLTETSIREIAESLRTLTQEGGAITVEISGPQELVDRVWRRYGESQALRGGVAMPEVRFVIDDAIDVRARVNDTVIESRLMEWVARIAEAVT
jgi:hypothetical protein